MIQIVLLRPGQDGRLTHLHPKGFPTGLCVPNIEALFTELPRILQALREKDPDNLRNVYYTVAHHTGLSGSMPSRKELSFEYQTILPFDLDYVDQARAWDYLPVVAKILGVSPHSLIFVSTGNGIHVMAHLETPIRSSKYLKETKPHYNELIYQINQELKARNLPGEGDPSVWEAARILRLPGTINQSEKKGTKEARLLQYPGEVRLDLDLKKLSKLDELALSHLVPTQLKRDYPRPDFVEVVKECRFMGWLKESPEEVHEPQFMMGVGLLGAMSPGDKVEVKGEELTAKEFGGNVFSRAQASKSLAREDFETKWEHGTRYGAPRCQTVSQNWIGGCEKCPHHGKINTPLALKSPDFISSSANGYWVMGSKGPLHPHYMDLKRLYQRQNAYVTLDPDRIFTFKETHYTPTTHLQIKAWVDRTVGHEEALRDVHCTEFLKTALRSRTLSPDEAADFFGRSIDGLVNCRNGVLDVRSGQLLPSSPQFGFRYTLPYDYVEGEVSEFFLDWLATVMQNRTELMDSLLDFMAYCLWPAYDDHVFTYLIGDGSNGKSTFLRVLQTLVGKENYSAVSIFQLGGHRFAPANLEGKLVNISGESSGSELTSQELNVIKELSAGGELDVERKGQQGFTFRNRAKLVFSANKPPRFHEQGNAIRRRLLSIPFDFTIERGDANVEDRLCAEVPKIMSMLIPRIQANLKENGGKFRVSRGGMAAALSQEKVLTAGNSAVEWGKEKIESGLTVPEEQYISCQEAYTQYKIWCEENGYKVQNSNVFAQYLVKHVLSGAVKGSKSSRVGGKIVRVYPRTRWKEETV